MNPPLKWLGSKRRLAPAILEHVPPDSYLVEPFAGSAALTFARSGPGWINDSNEHLMAFYRDLVEDWPDLIGNVIPLWLAYSGTDERYYHVRDMFNGKLDPGSLCSGTWNSALFYFLNKHSYSGLWRVNAAGQMNAPWGKVSPKPPKPLTFQKASEHLAGITLTCGSYEDCVPDRGDVVYLDPPYPTTFGGYTQVPVDYAGLRDWAEDLPCKVLVSGLEGDATWDGWRCLNLGSVRHSVRKGSRRKVEECLYVKG